MKPSIVFVALLCGICSCIDPFDIPSPESTRIVTVDGLVSTGHGPHLVTLSYANQYTNRSDGNRLPLRNAKVSIVDDLGNEVNLTEENIVGERWICFSGWILQTEYPGFIINLRTGRYFTPDDFCAIVGRTYTLHITLNNGEKYKSDPVTVTPVAPLGSVSVQPFSAPGANPLINQVGIELIVSFTDPANTTDHYHWNLSNSIIELVTEPHMSSGAARAPDGSGNLVGCDVCYMPDMEARGYFVSDNDYLFDGLSTSRSIMRIPDDGIRFKSHYQVQVNQYAISEQAHRFLKLVKQQLETQGSVFDPPPANIRGNIRSVDDPDQQIMGYFIAADVSSITINIDRADIPPEFLARRIIIPRCCMGYCGRLHYPPTLLPPKGWKQ